MLLVGAAVGSRNLDLDLSGSRTFGSGLSPGGGMLSSLLLLLFAVGRIGASSLRSCRDLDRSSADCCSGGCCRISGAGVVRVSSSFRDLDRSRREPCVGGFGGWSSCLDSLLSSEMSVMSQSPDSPNLSIALRSGNRFFATSSSAA